MLLLTMQSLVQPNVLLFGPNIVKLADFGQSRSFDSDYPEPCLKTTTYNRTKGTCRWLAYELAATIMSNEDDDDMILVYTKESDVWAFGMVLYVSYNI